MLEWCLDACREADRVASIVIAAPPEEEERAATLAGAGAGVEVVAGGAHRSESVAAALRSVRTELVVVHDVARPLVTGELIDACIGELAADEELEGVVAATPVTDTIKEVARGHEVARTLDRSSLWAAQTPQAFRTESLRRALDSTELLAQATDDAMLLERIGGRVILHEAPPRNIKVTTPVDLHIAELLVSQGV
jgi:2-C-methyl-D-erythritol 4-phosphate cytidylyltransferase